MIGSTDLDLLKIETGLSIRVIRMGRVSAYTMSSQGSLKTER